MKVLDQLSLFEADVEVETDRAIKAAPIPPLKKATQYGPELSPQQAKVRDHSTGNQVVVAGAGTGKTEALTQRILKLLVEGDGHGPTALESVLALTFTDKGAAEMRGRVYSLLVQILRSMPRGQNRNRLEQIRADFAENNRILTFDAFAFRLLGQFPGHSPLPGDVEILDDSKRSDLRREVTRQFWNRVESTFSESEKQKLWELLEVFPGRRSALDNIARLAEEESEADLRSLANLPNKEEWREEFEALVSRDGETLWSSLEAEIRKLDMPPELRSVLLDAEQILLPGRNGMLTQKGWSAAFIKRWTPELVPGLGRVERKLLEWKAEVSVDRDFELDWRSRCAVARLCRHALWWQSAHREWCAAEGVASFSDVSNAALELLQNSEVAARLRSNFSHVLIDEFQDTNWRQWALIDALRDKFPGNVLIVGDEKQAIFRFRGGDITVFDGVRKILLGAATPPDELTVSRRSTRQLVGWTNTVFRGVLPSSQTRKAYEAPFQDLDSQKEAEVNGLWQLEPASWHLDEENELIAGKVPSTAIQRDRAGRSLARFLRALCDDAEKWKASETPHLHFPDLAEVSRKISRDESAIGVVFTTHDVKSVFEAQLRAFDVPFVSVRGTGYWSSEPVTWTLHLLRLLLDANDRTAFVGLARTAIGALSDVALMEWHLALAEKEEQGTPTSCFDVENFLPSRAEDARAWPLFLSRLREWRDLARVEAASAVVEHVLESTEIAFYEAALSDAQQREQNWRKIIDLLREREADGEGGLRALIDHLSGLVSEAENGDKEANAPLPQGGSIQLMTVFASKGLGFPMTVLAQLDGAPQSKAGLLLRGNLDGTRQMAFRMSDDDEDDKKAPKPWVWEKLRAQDAAEEEAQWRRLFYVACTRAESHLVLLTPEREVKNGAAWCNLCADGQRELIELRPVGSIPRERAAQASALAEPTPQPPPLLPAVSVEVSLHEIAGERAEKFGARAREFLEGRVPDAEIREELPFSAPADSMQVGNATWVVGAWEWLAVAPDDSVTLVATGPNKSTASTRAHFMALAARDAGFQVCETWALWPRGEETEAVLVEGAAFGHTFYPT